MSAEALDPIRVEWVDRLRGLIQMSLSPPYMKMVPKSGFVKALR